MAQHTEEADYDALFEEAGDLDNLPLSGDVMPGDKQADAAREEVAAEPVEDGLEHEDFYETEQPLETRDEPELTPEQVEDRERQDILAGSQDLLRRQRDFEARHGKPVVPPEQVAAAQKTQESVASLRTDTPEVAQAVEAIVAEKVQEAVGDIAQAVDERVSNETLSIRMKAHDDAILATDVGDIYAAVKTDQQQLDRLIGWIEALPTAAGTAYLDILDQGTSDQVIGMLRDFKEYPDPEDASKAIRSLMDGARQAPEETQQRRPQGRPTRSQTRVPEAARAVRSRGTQSVPVASGTPQTDDFDQAYQAWGDVEAEEARRAANQR